MTGKEGGLALFTAEQLPVAAAGPRPLSGFRLLFLRSSLLAEPTLRVSGPLVSMQLLLRAMPVGSSCPEDLLCPEDTGGQCPRAEPKSHVAFFHGRNSYQNHKQKSKTNTQKMERLGFCKVLLGSYFYIILPISGLCSENLKTNALCFYGFLWRCPSGQALSGGHPGQSSGGISQVQTRGEPANVAFLSQWAVFWLLCIF